MGCFLKIPIFGYFPNHIPNFIFFKSLISKHQNYPHPSTSVARRHHHMPFTACRPREEEVGREEGTEETAGKEGRGGGEEG